MRPDELKRRGADGDPLHDLADFCDYNEHLVLKAVNEERAQKAAEKKAQRKRR